MSRFSKLLPSTFFCASNLLATPYQPLPTLVEILPVAPDTVALVVQQGEVIPTRLVPYIRDPEDRIEPGMYDAHLKPENGVVTRRTVYRGKELIGYLSGPGESSIVLEDRYRGIPLDIAAAESPASYSLQSSEDDRFKTALAPASVSRKGKPNGFSRRENKTPALHTIYLKFPQAFRENATYELDLGALNLQEKMAAYTHSPRYQRSDAVHVNQVGFAPDDAIKIGYLSMWTGKNGGVAYGDKVKFHVVDLVRGINAFSGESSVHWPAARPEHMFREANLVGADVYRMDFSAVTRPGLYHLYVEGVGCSYPFEIRPDAWEKVARTGFRGVFHQRSGFEFGQPYTDFWRPRAHHPADGVKIRQSTVSLLDSSMGIELDKGKEAFTALIEGATDIEVPEAWGGVMDAGDWDRRAQHLSIPRLFFEAYKLTPEFYSRFKINIPESANDLPDIVDEGLWILDFFLRLQREDGAVRGGVESSEHPTVGDLSWNESVPVYAYAPDYWSTHEFVATAAMASRILGKDHPELAKTYRTAALKGMLWAESEFAKEVASGRIKTRVQGVLDARNLAAFELFRLTKDETWHEVFKQDSILANSKNPIGTVSQRDALFGYQDLPDGLGDPAWKEAARKAIVADGDRAVQYADNNAFSLVAPSKDSIPWIGFFSGLVNGQHLVRAHALTEDPRYLVTLQKGAQFSLGANPDNVVYMAGIGSKHLKNILYTDAFKTGRLAPEGNIPYGPFDNGAPFVKPGSIWVDALERTHPDPTTLEPQFKDWPATESYIDMRPLYMQNECTPQQTMAPSAYSWGYLAARTALTGKAGK